MIIILEPILGKGDPLDYHFSPRLSKVVDIPLIIIPKPDQGRGHLLDHLFSSRSKLRRSR